ncbi:hypothetical protein ACEN5R_07560 [Streptococcus pyogenes]|uniref:hypothetical protein n=1 Tax=Streptococcus pyogenes TaxID=1314 RepID=UPI000DA3A5E7|nr:hypothetical protein [Streptococcus pyogenes]UEN85469.1 hypothetical protein H7793_00935 [Streptococcus pyogenes]SQF01325.1 Uncharacterised protein [Streptococcus pyogenes]VGS62841.1 Uncharacterised protein [Streptococcus pyogenes]VGS71052.1 Uncharacterised protein [Streptococcus pyogenes]VGT04641.1 Uncharacterised protein [Streptococcus pyogenes]
MKQQSYQPLRFVYLLVALFAAMLLVARPVMADEGTNSADAAYYKGKDDGEKAGKEAGQKANWTDLTPTDPVPPSDDVESNQELYKDGYKDGYKLGYDEIFSERFPWLIPVKFIWGIILHWWGK